MKKIILIMMAISATITQKSFGQNNENYSKFGKSSLSASYGYKPIYAMDWWSDPLFHSMANVSQADKQQLKSTINSNIGVISIAYNNQINEWLELQIPLSYTYSSGTLQAQDGINIPSEKFKESFFGFTPNVKFSWFRKDLYCLYSRLGIGLAIGNRYEDNNAGLNSKFAFTWQASPIGFEIGRRACFFIEAGFGQFGVVNAGVKVRFNKATVKPDGTKREVKDWSDKYLR